MAGLFMSSPNTVDSIHKFQSQVGIAASCSAGLQPLAGDHRLIASMGLERLEAWGSNNEPTNDECTACSSETLINGFHEHSHIPCRHKVKEAGVRNTGCKASGLRKI